MKIGGRCSLSGVEDQEKFIREEIEKFYGKPIAQLNIDSDLKREFCKICKNIMC
jgi:hypothetical protein